MNFENQWAATEQHLAEEANSLGELLERLRTRISSALIGEPQWQGILERVRPLPATIAAFPFGFELPLHEPEPCADFGVAVFGGSRTAAYFEEAARSDSSNSSAVGIAGLLAASEPEDAPLRRVAGRKMLLEYDIDTTGRSAHPEPGIFLYPADNVLIGDRSPSRLRDLGIVSDAIAAATGRKLDETGRRPIEAVYLAMEPDSCIRAVGAFPSRGSGLRLAITGFRQTGSVGPLLARIGWPGNVEKVAAIESRYRKRGAFAYLGVHFDMQANGVGPTLGLSFYAKEGQWLKDIRHWTPLIDGISEDGLAVPEKLSALTEAWSGAQIVFGRAGPLILVRGIHHIKFTVIEDRIEQVKAYVFMLMLVSPLSEGKSTN